MNFLEYVWIRGIQKIPSEYKNYRRNTKKISDYRWIHRNSTEFKLNSWEYNEFSWIHLNSRNTENTVRIQELQKEYKKVLWLQINTREFTWIGYSKDGSKRKCEEQNDFHWLGKRRGGDWANHTPRLTSRRASGSRFVLHTSVSGHPWSTLFKLNSVEYNEFARGAEVMNTYEYIWIQYDCVWIL